MRARLRQRLRQKLRKGFTLIELMIVVVIIGILANIGIAGYKTVMDRARNVNVAANVKSIQQGLENYAGDHSGQPPSDNDADDNSFGSIDSVLGFRANSYLSGNSLPPGPWSSVAQQGTIAVPAILPKAGTSGPTSSPSPGPGQGDEIPIGAGAIKTSPASATDYGAVPYDAETSDGTYVLYGVGKRGKTAVTVGVASNSGVVLGQ